MKTLMTLIAAICLVGAALAQPSNPPKPGPEHQKLSIWFGDWTFESEMQATPLGPAGKGAGKATVRPILGGFFMEWRSEGKGPAGPSQYFEVDGYDALNKRYTWNGFESDGSANSATYTIEGTTVSYSGTTLQGDKQFRFRGTVVFDAGLASFIEKRELSVDGQTWMPNFTIKFIKAKNEPDKVKKAKKTGDRP